MSRAVSKSRLAPDWLHKSEQPVRSQVSKLTQLLTMTTTHKFPLQPTWKLCCASSTPSTPRAWSSGTTCRCIGRPPPRRRWPKRSWSTIPSIRARRSTSGNQISKMWIRKAIRDTSDWWSWFSSLHVFSHCIGSILISKNYLLLKTCWLRKRSKFKTSQKHTKSSGADLGGGKMVIFTTPS